jgi:hypothetical protein
MFTFLARVKLAILSCFLLCGCAGPQMTLVNNTPYTLDVTAGNQMISTNLPPGHTLKVSSPPWRDRIGVVVAGYDSQGHYIGANDWTFYCGQDQVWRIDRITKPNP